MCRQPALACTARWMRLPPLKRGTKAARCTVAAGCARGSSLQVVGQRRRGNTVMSALLPPLSRLPWPGRLVASGQAGSPYQPARQALSQPAMPGGCLPIPVSHWIVRVINIGKPAHCGQAVARQRQTRRQLQQDMQQGRKFTQRSKIFRKNAARPGQTHGRLHQLAHTPVPPAASITAVWLAGG